MGDISNLYVVDWKNQSPNGLTFDVDLNDDQSEQKSLYMEGYLTAHISQVMNPDAAKRISFDITRCYVVTVSNNSLINFHVRYESDWQLCDDDLPFDLANQYHEIIDKLQNSNSLTPNILDLRDYVLSEAKRISDEK